MVPLTHTNTCIHIEFCNSFMLGDWKALPQARSTRSPIYTHLILACATNPNGQGGCYTVKNDSNLNVQVFKFQMASCYCPRSLGKMTVAVLQSNVENHRNMHSPGFISVIETFGYHCFHDHTMSDKKIHSFLLLCLEQHQSFKHTLTLLLNLNLRLAGVHNFKCMLLSLNSLFHSRPTYIAL